MANPRYSAQTSLAELATAHAGASRVFQRHGLDFCCQGQRSLAEACGERGLDPGSLLQELAEQRGTVLDRSAPTDALIAHVVAHYHRRLREELPALVSMALEVERVHASKAACPRGLAAHLERTWRELESHMAKEETVLFPLIASGHVRLDGPVRVMEAEHRDHALNLQQLRRLTSDFIAPQPACATWRALYLRLSEFERERMEHVHLENHVLFPRALGGAS